MTLNKPLDQISEDDLQALVADKVAEKKTIEYKGTTLPGNADSDKKEFLADASSFANASGGHLIYGIKEDGGIPVEVCGVEIDDIDAAIRRLDNLMRDGISPRLPGPPPIQPVRLTAKPHHYVFIIRIQRSWAQPHRVIYQNHGHFYSRNSAGKYPLDVSELRTAFDLSGTIAERVRNFRAERLSKIVAGEAPALLEEIAPKLVLHIIPFGALGLTSEYNLRPLLNYSDYNTRNLIEPLMLARGSGGTTPRRNFDGVLIHKTLERGVTTSYTQFFRNGIIEAVDTSVLNVAKGIAKEPVFPGSLLDERLFAALSRYLKVQKLLEVELPVFVMVSLLGVKHYRITIPEDRGFNLNDQIDRPDLIVPEALIDTFESDVAQAIKPTLDTIWNAGGWERSMSYDAAGNWKHT